MLNSDIKKRIEIISREIMELKKNINNALALLIERKVNLPGKIY